MFRLYHTKVSGGAQVCYFCRNSSRFGYQRYQLACDEVTVADFKFLKLVRLFNVTEDHAFDK